MGSERKKEGGKDSRVVWVERRETGEWERNGKEGTDVNACLDARLGAGALEDDIKPTRRLIEARAGENTVCDRLCTVHVVLEGEFVDRRPDRRRRWFRRGGRGSSKGGGGRVDNVVDEARLDGEFEASLVDVDADDVGGTLGAGECAGKEPDGASAEDEDGRVASEGCAAGGVEDDA